MGVENNERVVRLLESRQMEPSPLFIYGNKILKYLLFGFISIQILIVYVFVAVAFGYGLFGRTTFFSASNAIAYVGCVVIYIKAICAIPDVIKYFYHNIVK